MSLEGCNTTPEETTTALPIDSKLVERLEAISRGTSTEKIHSVVLLLDEGDPELFYNANNARATPIDLNRTTIAYPPKILHRFDSLTSVVYTTNPVCRWVCINGRLTLICA